MMTETIILLCLVALMLVWWLWRLIAARSRRDTGGVPERAIVVDGSNVMHWGGGPSGKVLVKVLRSLSKQGHVPIVFFDANVGYKLGDGYFDEARMAKLTGFPQKHILVAHKGVSADEWILDFASRHGLRVVSNDRFRDWTVQYPIVKEKGRMMRGTYRQGAVVWR